MHIPLAEVRQDLYASDLPEAVVRLEPWLGDVNILLLPDVIYQTSRDPLAPLAQLAEESGFAFAAAQVSSERVKQLGALKVSQDDVVRAYEDKPASSAIYNAAWGMIGFSGSLGLLGMRVVAASTAKQHHARPPVIGAPVVWFEDFRDCGTWDGYLGEVSRYAAVLQH
jgi:hypothetical protein